MPEISDAELRQFVRYQMLGTPEEVEKKITTLERDNHKYRQEEKPALEAKLPKEGEVVLPKAKADLLPAYEELGKPEEIKTKLSTAEQTQAELAQVKLREAAQKFAKAAGLADEAVDTLIAIPQLKDAKFEVRKGKVKDAKGVEVDGEIGYITLAGENQKAMKFTEAQESIPALKGLRTAAPASSGRPGGAPFLPQPAGGGDTPASNVYEQIRKEREAAKKGPDPEQQQKFAERLGIVAPAR